MEISNICKGTNQNKTKMMYELSKDFKENGIVINDVCYEDKQVVEYYGTKNGKHCIISIPKNQTSWSYDITME